ncbi:transmembrane protein 272 [Xiphophorus hellerii]|uniref:transmembrane protein 272 n=1 Tax=Xiphophorus hellerii TaxID=8084 RepID=UPI0013B3FD29|nr:transmembrane protein 272-like [Xiphophorus hellerii]
MNAIKDPHPAVLGVSKVIVGIMPIAYIAVGAVYLNECPVQEKIPIYLIVSGVFTIVLNLLSCLPGTRSTKDTPRTTAGHVVTVWNSLVSLFLFCWFISGNIWIYSIYQPEYNKNATDVSRYCNKTLYLFAFWNTTLVYILVILFVLTGCCVLFCLFLWGRADSDDDANQQA